MSKQLDPISAVHQQIEAQLLPWFKVGHWTIQAVPSPLTLREFNSLMRATAWIGISWVEHAPRPGGSRRLDGTLKFRLTLCVKNTDKTVRLFGDRLGPGLYPAMATAAMALHGVDVPGHGSLLVTRVAQSFADGYSDETIALGIIELEMVTALGDVLGAVEAAPAFAVLVSSFELLDEHGVSRLIATDINDLPAEEAP